MLDHRQLNLEVRLKESTVIILTGMSETALRVLQSETNHDRDSFVKNKLLSGILCYFIKYKIKYKIYISLNFNFKSS